MGLLDRVDLEPFGGVWEKELIDDFDLVIGSSDGGHGRHDFTLEEGERRRRGEVKVGYEKLSRAGSAGVGNLVWG